MILCSYTPCDGKKQGRAFCICVCATSPNWDKDKNHMMRIMTMMIMKMLSCSINTLVVAAALKQYFLRRRQFMKFIHMYRGWFLVSIGWIAPIYSKQQG